MRLPLSLFLDPPLAMTMAKRTASQYDGRFEDELSTKRPQDFLAVFFLTKRVQRTAEYGEILNFDLAYSCGLMSTSVRLHRQDRCPMSVTVGRIAVFDNQRTRC